MSLPRKLTSEPSFTVKPFLSLWPELLASASDADLGFYVNDIFLTCQPCHRYTEQELAAFDTYTDTLLEQFSYTFTFDTSTFGTDFWFLPAHCHWNVILPCLLLNNRAKRKSRYKIIIKPQYAFDHYGRRYRISDDWQHSAIYDTITGTVFDPTYEMYVDLGSTDAAFEEGYQLVTLKEHVAKWLPGEAEFYI